MKKDTVKLGTSSNACMLLRREAVVWWEYEKGHPQPRDFIQCLYTLLRREAVVWWEYDKGHPQPRDFIQCPPSFTITIYVKSNIN
jgi:hypothetical protein